MLVDGVTGRWRLDVAVRVYTDRRIESGYTCSGCENAERERSQVNRIEGARLAGWDSPEGERGCSQSA